MIAFGTPHCLCNYGNPCATARKICGLCSNCYNFRFKFDADPTVTAVARRHNKFPSQIALRFLLEIGVGAIPSTANSTYQQQNLDVFDFELSPAEVRNLSKVVAPCRGEAALGLTKCWADPSTMMCMDANGRTFHCP